MATIEERTGPEVRAGALGRVDRMVAGASTLEAVAGAAGVILPILGLVGVLPVWMAGIAVIVIAGGLLLEGAGLLTQYGTLLATSREGVLGVAPEMAGGVAVQVLGGAAGLVLGIVALRSGMPVTLLSIAILVLGGSMLLGAGSTARLSALQYRLHGGETEVGRRAADEAVRSASSAEIFTGLGALVLGVVALTAVATVATGLTLVLAACLALGSSVFLAGTSLGARMVAILRQR